MPETATYDHYEVLTRENGSLYELGRGAMGVTYKAFDTRLQYPVCLKVISAAFLQNELIRQRFVREARSAAKLRHPNVASVFHLGAEGDTWYYAMEFIDGETLEALIKREGSLAPKLALEITAQVARALNAAAQRSLVHRDIKPANLMLLDEDGEVLVKVIDFGLAKAPAEGENEATLSMGGFIGTAQFASPEQLEERQIDTRSDIYSLGVTLWMMLAGRPPFRGSLAQVMNQHLSKPPPFAELDGQAPEVVGLLKKMLEKNPANRFQTPVELRKATERVIEKLNAPPVSRAAAAAPAPKVVAPSEAKETQAKPPVERLPSEGKPESIITEPLLKAGAPLPAEPVLPSAPAPAHTMPEDPPLKEQPKAVSMERTAAPPASVVKEQKAEIPQSAPSASPAPAATPLERDLPAEASKPPPVRTGPPRSFISKPSEKEAPGPVPAEAEPSRPPASAIEQKPEIAPPPTAPASVPSHAIGKGEKAEGGGPVPVQSELLLSFVGKPDQKEVAGDVPAPPELQKPPLAKEQNAEAMSLAAMEPAAVSAPAISKDEKSQAPIEPMFPAPVIEESVEKKDAPPVSAEAQIPSSSRAPQDRQIELRESASTPLEILPLDPQKSAAPNMGSVHLEPPRSFVGGTGGKADQSQVSVEPQPLSQHPLVAEQRAETLPPVSKEPTVTPDVPIRKDESASVPPPTAAEPLGFRPAPAKKRRRGLASSDLPPAPSLAASVEREQKVEVRQPSPAKPRIPARRATRLRKMLASALPVAAAIATVGIGVGIYYYLQEPDILKTTDLSTPGPTTQGKPVRIPELTPPPNPNPNLKGGPIAASTPAGTPRRTPAPSPGGTREPMQIDRLALAVKEAENLENQGRSRAALEGYLRIVKDFPDRGAIAGRNHIETLIERLRTTEPAMTTEQFESMQNLVVEAGRQNVLSAMLMLGQRLKSQSPAESFEWFRKAADTGDAAACDYVGRLLLEGVSGVVVKDPRRAAAYFERAAEKGDARSKAALGEYYLVGYGGRVEEALGIKLLREAVAAGNPHAMNFLGDYFAKKAKRRPKSERKAASAEYQEAFNLFTESKDLGDVKALSNLGLLYMQGVTPGARGPEYEKAVALFAQGAKYADPFSMYSYARCLESGIGVEKDPAEAKRWDVKAGRSKDKDFIKWSVEHNISLPGRPTP